MGNLLEAVIAVLCKEDGTDCKYTKTLTASTKLL